MYTKDTQMDTRAYVASDGAQAQALPLHPSSFLPTPYHRPYSANFHILAKSAHFKLTEAKDD